MTSLPLQQAVVLCAGHGTRLGALARNTPKPMLPVAGRPLIQHITERLFHAGLSEIILVVGPDAHPFESLFQDNPRIRFAEQSLARGTADALCAAAHLLQHRFLLTYGDLWIAAQDYQSIRVQAERQNQNYLAVNRTDSPSGAAVYINGDRVTGIIEKPVWNGRSDTCWNAAGLYILDDTFLTDCRHVLPSSRGELELASAIGFALKRSVAIYPYVMSQPHIDIGVAERYHDLRARLES